MSDEIKIETGITIPAPRTKYPFAEMSVGESFFLPAQPGMVRYNAGSLNRVNSAASQHGRRTGKKFSVRTQPCGGMRIWRTA